MRKLSVALVALSFALVACEEKFTPPPPRPLPGAPEKKPDEPVATKGPATPEPKKPPAPPRMTFLKKGPSAGAKYQEKEVTELKFVVTMTPPKGKPTKLDVSKKDRTTRNVEVIEANDLAPTKLKVTFKEASDTETDLKGREKTRKLPYADRTYLVSLKGGKVTVTTEKGKTAPKKEADLVAAKFSDLGEPDPVVKAMPTRALPIGDEVAELADAIRAQMTRGSARSSKEKVDLKDVSARLVTDKGDSGVFEVKATMTMGEGPMAMSIALSGELEVRKVDARPLSLSLSGPMTITSGEGKGPKLDGSGTMSAEASFSEL